MLLRTERAQVKDVRERFEISHPEAKSQIEKLKVLDTDTANAADVAKIIGNPSWVRAVCCSECNRPSYDVVQLGEPPDYESHTAWVCKGCLEKALTLLNGGDINGS